MKRKKNNKPKEAIEIANSLLASQPSKLKKIAWPAVLLAAGFGGSKGYDWIDSRVPAEQLAFANMRTLVAELQATVDRIATTKEPTEAMMLSIVTKAQLDKLMKRIDKLQDNCPRAAGE